MSYQQAMLRSEGLAVVLVGVWLFARIDGTWALWLGFLAPDLSAIAFLRGPRLGSAAYNFVHWYLWPLLLAGFGLLSGTSLALEIALIWAAHLGIDRALGYGLRYASGQRDTTIRRA